MDLSHMRTKTVNIDSDLLSILCCPETKQRVSLLDTEKVALLNQKIQQGELTNLSGAKITEPLQGGLIRTDGKRVYPIREDIPIMLIEEGISVEDLD